MLYYRLNIIKKLTNYLFTGLSTLKFTTTSIDRRPLKSIENVFNILPSTCTASFQNPDQEISISTPPVPMEKENIGKIFFLSLTYF